MDEQERYARARRRVGEIRGFCMHFAVYIIFNVFFFILSMVTDPGVLRSFWVAFFRGSALHSMRSTRMPGAGSPAESGKGERSAISWSAKSDGDPVPARPAG
jgi:hypothetical protein